MAHKVYYSSYNSDIVTSRNQDYRLPDDYSWVMTGLKDKLISSIVYIIAVVFSFFYCHLVWNIKVVGRQNLKKAGNEGYFVYGNHTQPFGDVFIPAYVNLHRRIYTIVSSANYGIPVIGKILPYLGAIPIPDNYRKMNDFAGAVSKHCGRRNCVVIFPEAHVWPYYTGIRPFGTSAFHYPVDEGKPAYCMTVTYRKRLFGQRPRITIYVDGPFTPDGTLSRHEQIVQLHRMIRDKMEERSRSSTYEYYEYVKKEEQI